MDESGKELTFVFGEMGASTTRTSNVMATFGRTMGIARSMIVQASISTFVFALMLRRLGSTQRRVQTAHENANRAILRYRLSLHNTTNALVT